MNEDQRLCCACGDPAGERPAIINTDAMCKECIVGYFEHAMHNETNWPPRWAGKRLDPYDFRYVGFATDLLNRFSAKEKEWDCPDQERVYCGRTDPPRRPEACGTFLGRRKDKKKCEPCEKCRWYTCLRCRETFSPSGVADARQTRIKINHSCKPENERLLREKAFKGLKRGKDYQDCPNDKCGRRIQLSEACNHITCLCGTELCYIYGEAATEGQDHWSSGGCVLYGQPERGLHDNENDADDEAEDRAEIDDESVRFQMHMLQRQQADADGQGGARVYPDMENMFGWQPIAPAHRERPDLDFGAQDFFERYRIPAQEQPGAVRRPPGGSAHYARHPPGAAPSWEQPPVGYELYAGMPYSRRPYDAGHGDEKERDVLQATPSTLVLCVTLCRREDAEQIAPHGGR